MLQIFVGVCWLITVAYLLLPDTLKNQFLKNNDRLITQILTTVSAIITIFHGILLTR